MPSPVDFGQRADLASKRYLSAKNNSAVNTIPPFGLVRVVSVDSSGLYTVDQPNADSQQVLVNGPQAIAPSGYGAVTQDWPTYAAYTGGPPATGQTWGAASGSYYLTSGKTGFTVQGGDTGASGNRALVAPPQPGSSAASGVTVNAVNPGTGDTTISFASATTIETDQTSGLTVISGTGGAPRMQIEAASATHSGAVNTAAQEFAGTKTFDNNVILKGEGGTSTGNLEFVDGSLVNLAYITATTSSPYLGRKAVVIQAQSASTGTSGPTGAAYIICGVGSSSYGTILALGDASGGGQQSFISVHNGTTYNDGVTGTGGGGDSFHGGICTALGAAGAATITIGTTTISGGTPGRFLYDNAGVVGEAIIGSGLSFSGGTLTATASSGITIGTTTITSGTTGRFLYDNAGVVGEAVIGSGLSFSGGTLTATATASDMMSTLVSTPVTISGTGTTASYNKWHIGAVSGAWTITLPAASANKIIGITNLWNGTNTLTVSGVAGAAPPAANLAPGASAIYYSDGSSWFALMLSADGIHIGVTPITSGSSGSVLYDNGGLFGELSLPDSVVKSGSTLVLSGDSSGPGNWQAYSTNGSGTKGWNSFATMQANNLFVASGASHAAGAVPDPGSTASTGRYLREDATWVAPPGEILGYNYVATDQSTTSTTYTDLTSADSVSVTVPTGGANVLVEFFCYIYNTVDNAVAGSEIFLDGVAQTGSVSEPSASNFYQWPYHLVYKLTSLAAGSHTIAVKHRTAAGQTGHWLLRSLIVSVAP